MSEIGALRHGCARDPRKLLPLRCALLTSRPPAIRRTRKWRSASRQPWSSGRSIELDVTAAYAIGAIAAYWLIERTATFLV